MLLLKSNGLVLSAWLLAVPAFAAGMACDRAVTPVETTVCDDAALREADARVARQHAQALRLQPERRQAFTAAQRQWLIERDRCGADAACLTQVHATRSAVLAQQIRNLPGFGPDDVDRRALAQLGEALEAAVRTDPENPLPQALRRFPVEGVATEFYSVASDGGDARFPTRRPAGVTMDEWEGLRRSQVEGGGEHGRAGYTLLDLDGDGRRDLVVDSYTGGTGLFSEISVLPRRGDRFAGRPSRGAQDEVGQPALYTLNGRGSNQSARWVSLQGRVYVAYAEGTYGSDSLRLLRPFSVQGVVPKLTLRYRYRLAIPVHQQREKEAGGPLRLTRMQHAGLLKGLRHLDGVVSPRGSGDGSKPLCPVPEGTADDEASAYASFGPGHYAFEVVGDFPVWFGEECRIGRLIDWFGAYGKDGLQAMLQVKEPTGDEQQEYQVDIRRRAVKVEQGWAERE